MVKLKVDKENKSLSIIDILFIDHKRADDLTGIMLDMMCEKKDFPVIIEALAKESTSTEEISFCMMTLGRLVEYQKHTGKDFHEIAALWGRSDLIKKSKLTEADVTLIDDIVKESLKLKDEYKNDSK